MFGSVLRLLGHGEPDGTAQTLQAEAIQAGAAAAEHLSGLRPSQPAPRPQTVVAAALGQKVLHSWLQNRHQTRFPLVLNLRNNSPEEVALLKAIVLRTLQTVDPGDDAMGHATAFFEGIGGDLRDASAPMDGDLIEKLGEARLVAEAYAACAGALGRRNPAARRFMEFLAARLDIPDEIARSINRRFAS